MTTPAKADVDDATKEALTGIALGDLEVLERALELREAWQESTQWSASTPPVIHTSGTDHASRPSAASSCGCANGLRASG